MSAAMTSGARRMTMRIGAPLVVTAPRPTAGRTRRYRYCRPRHATPQGGLFREIDLGDLRGAGGLELEVLPRSLPDELRCEHLREAADVGVVAVCGLIVVLARHGDAVLRPLKLVLQRAEVLVRLELGVVLRDREQPAQRRGEGGVGGRHLLEVARLDRARQLGPRLGDRGEDRLLLLGVPLHGL